MNVLRVLVAFCGLAIGLFGAPTLRPAIATEAGLTRVEPIQRNPAFPARTAILVVPQANAGSTSSSQKHADEAGYRERLRQLGFEVVAIGPGGRLEIDRLTRQVAATMLNNADVVVFVLGQVLSEGSDLYVVPDDAPIGLEAAPRGTLATEGLPLTDLLRRLAARNPRSLFAFVDECRRVDRPNEPCGLDAASDRDASIIAVHRTAIASARAPDAGRASARDTMTELMTSPGINALQLFLALQDRLNGSGLSVTATRSLPSLFAFHPADFFPRLDHACNGIDASADAEKVRRTNIAPLVEACTQAIRQWPFVSHFERQRAAGAEQLAFSRAAKSCDDVPTIMEYAMGYPVGRYRPALQEFVAACDKSLGGSWPPPTKLTGRGWEMQYNATILRLVSLDVAAGHPDDTVRSTWQSVEHGTDAVMTLVIGANTGCLNAHQFLHRHIIPLRRDVRWAEDIHGPERNVRGVLVHGLGAPSTTEPQPAGIHSMDAVLVTVADMTTYLHLGIQFKAELGYPMIDEFQRIAESIKLTAANTRRVTCRG